MVHPCLDFSVVIYAADITKSVWNSNQAQISLPRHPICINDTNHDYILDAVMRWNQIEFERQIYIGDNYI